MAVLLALTVGLCGTAVTVLAQAQTATSTTLGVTSGGTTVTSVTAGSVVTLTATVNASSAAVTLGQVNFCDASATLCTDIHRLGTAQLTSAGTATLRFRPGIGSHLYKAVFAGTNSYMGSSSTASTLAVTGTISPLASTTTIAESGSWGAYTLTGTVTEAGGTVPLTGTVSFLDSSDGNSVLGTATLGSSVAGVGWPNPKVLTTDYGINSVVLGDFNGDGIPDLVVNAGNELAILLGDAYGMFTATAPVTSLPGPPVGVVSADFNGDGKQDLAVTIYGSGAISILLGKGDGTFTLTAAGPALGIQLTQFTVGDFNGDGIPDLALINDSTSAVTILLGNGDATFAAASTNPAISGYAKYFAVGDFNSDGKLDLAVTKAYDDTVSILLGNGDGTFAAAASVHCGGTGLPISAADFNADGKLDISVGFGGSAGASEGVATLSGNGDGTFTSPSAGQAVTSTSVNSIQVGDFNRDGFPDVVVADSFGRAAVFLNNGSAALNASYPVVTVSSPYNLIISVGDINGDGWPDIAAGSYYSNRVSLFLTAPTQTATATVNISLPSAGLHQVGASYGGDSKYNSSTSAKTPLWGVPPVTTTTLSVTSGGVPVTAVAPGTVVTLTAKVNAGTSPVTSGQVNFCDASASYCTDIHVQGSTALASDGTATFKFAPGAGVHSYKAMYVQSGLGVRSASNTSTLTVGPAPALVYTDTTSITANGSPGDYSLTATVQGIGGTAAPTGNVWFLDTSFGNSSLATATLGPSTAGIGWLVSQTPTVGNYLTQEAAGDFNGDGIQDLAVVWSSSYYGGPYSVTVLFGKGDGTFLAGPTVQPAGVQSYPRILAGDINGDGKTDLAILSSAMGNSTSYITALLGNGDGTFSSPATGVAFNQGVVGGDWIQGSMVAADFNGDGKIDLAVVGDYVYTFEVTFSSGGVTILLGNGDGTFKASGSNLLPNRGLGLIATGDFNGDGIPDLFVADYFSPATGTILLGKGDGSFTVVGTPVPVSTFSKSAVVGDFNGDSVHDLSVGNTGSVQVFLGNGDGTFNEVAGSPVSGAGTSLTAGDFNHDGKLDFAGTDDYSDRVNLYFGVGDGTFANTTTTTRLSTGPSSIVASDFDGDGIPDLASLHRSLKTASILLTRPTETASATVTGIAPVGAGTHNVKASYSGDGNYSAGDSSTVALAAGMKPVVISPASGSYFSVQTITLSESIPGATIYYWASGTVNTNGFVPYTGPISLTLGGAEKIEAYATEAGYQQSDYTTATFTLNLPAAPPPVISLASGNYPDTQTATISEAAPGATIYYTMDGSSPTTSSTVYTGPITVSTSGTLAAIATASGYGTSKVSRADYFIGSSLSSFIYTVAGNSSSGYGGDGGQATLASLNMPTGTAIDSAGNIYIADTGNNVVRRVAAATGTITTVAGTGIAGYSGDNGPATSAQLWSPFGVAVDATGNIYIADNHNNVVRKVTAGSGIITTYAGNTSATTLGDNGPASSAQLSNPVSLVLDSGGNLYISESLRVRKVIASTGIIATVAGNGNYGYTGDNGPAISAALANPLGLAVDGAGNLYIADTWNSVVRKVAASTGTITTVAGKGPNWAPPFYGGDGGPATSAVLHYPYAVAVDATGNIYIADTQNLAVRKVSASTGVINTIVGHPPASCFSLSGDGAPAIASGICFPEGIAVDSAGNLYIAESSSSRIRKVTVPMSPPTMATATPVFDVPAGTYVNPQSVSITDATPGAEIYLTVNGTVPTTAGEGYHGPINVTGSATLQAVAVAPGHLPSAPVTAVYTITTPPTAVVSTVAGNGEFGASGVGGPAIKAALKSPSGVAFDESGNIYIADHDNSVVWRVVAGTGLIDVAAGTLGEYGDMGDGGPATSAFLDSPSDVTFDGAGNMYIADSGNNKIRKVAAKTGIISVYAGGGSWAANLGDGGPATLASLFNPQALASDAAGNLYIVDQANRRIRMVSASTGTISTVAGGTTTGTLGDGGPATSAMLTYPTDVVVDSQGNLYIADPSAGRVRKVTATTGVITTLAGNGNAGTSGNVDPATSAEVSPDGLALDGKGNLYLSNWPNLVRMVPVKGGAVTTVAGSGYGGFGGDGGSATMAGFCSPSGLAFDNAGSLYIADMCNSRVRKVTFTGQAAIPAFSPVAGTYLGTQTVTITDSTANATIYFTTDGSTPTTGSTVYSGAITVASSKTVKAIAVATGYTESPAAEAPYIIQDIALPSSPLVVNVAVGHAQTSTFTVSSVGGFTGTVSFACSVPANMNEASCSAGSVQLNGNTSADSTLTVSTTGPHLVASTGSHERRFVLVAASLLAGFFWLGAPAARRRREMLLTGALALLLGLTNCGGGGNSGGGGGGGGHTDQGTAPGSYTLTLTATSGPLSHTMHVTVNVQ